MTKSVTLDLEAYRKKLLAERKELEHDVEASAPSREPVELDQTSVGRLSRMDALQNQAMALETERRREIELARVDAALKRIDSGDYGFCVTCGEDISPERLQSDPATPQCIDCASMHA